MSDNCSRVETVVRGIADASFTMFIKSTDAANLIAELTDENAKLRELVETMYVDMREMLDIMDKSSDTRGYCRYYGECLDAAEGIMRELGIEVD